MSEEDSEPSRSYQSMGGGESNNGVNYHKTKLKIIKYFMNGTKC